jgi:16S rRNA (cytosine967-C5)-methyltransferase
VALVSEIEPGLSARLAALDLLDAALARRNGLEEALAVPALAALSSRDRGFAMALVMATLRALGPIDRALDARLARQPPARARQILRLGLAQALVLGTPPHAAVATSVSLVGRAGPAAFKGLVNAVLRAVLREPPALDDPDLLAPDWLYARWRAAYGPDVAREIAACIAKEPATDLTCRDPDAASALAPGLEADVLPGGTLRTGLRGDVTGWPGFAEGDWWVQDAAAAVPARLLAVQAGEAVLDLCAAPGGKTLQLAAAGADVTALDRSAARLKRLQENLHRMRLSAEIVVADAAEWAGERQFDAVLLDAPCSSTGTARRHPDVPWTKSPADVEKLADLQLRMLHAASRLVRPGGRLVFSNCSLDPLEGEALLARFLHENETVVLEPIRPGEVQGIEHFLTREGTLRTTPGDLDLGSPALSGLDGFFAARLRREAD